MKGNKVYLSGFADEAADDIDGQIRAVKALQWSFIEARSINGVNIHDLDDKTFDQVCERLGENGIRINCFGTTIANWGKDVSEDFSLTLKTVERAAGRMKRLSVPLARIMSYKIILDASGRPLKDQKEKERFERLREICGIFLAEGITPIHENCLNYGGMSWEHTLRLLDAVPGLKLVYDTGNPALTPDFRKPYPYPNQDSLEVWEHLKPYVAHIHIKDGLRIPESGEEKYFYPGEGGCSVREILSDTLSRGYTGTMTIEPHMTMVYHHQELQSAPEIRFGNFVEYGKRTEDLLRSIGCTVANGEVSK